MKMHIVDNSYVIDTPTFNTMADLKEYIMNHNYQILGMWFHENPALWGEGDYYHDGVISIYRQH